MREDNSETINSTDKLIPITAEMKMNEPCFRKEWLEIKPAESNKYKSPLDHIRDIARSYGFTVNDILGRQQTRDVAHVRQEVYYELRKAFKLSYPRIGQLVGGRDHTAVMHGIKQHKRRVKAKTQAANAALLQK